MAEAGRAKGLGEARPVMPGEVTSGKRVSDEWCWRTVKTNVLLSAMLAHCGWAT
jgi:hypothetical protein